MKLGFPFSYHWKITLRGEEVESAAAGEEGRRSASDDTADGAGRHLPRQGRPTTKSRTGQSR